MATHRGSGGPRRPEPDYLEVGRVLRPWGVRGAMRLAVLTSHPDDLAAGQRVFVGEARTPHQVRSARVQKGALIVHLLGCDTPEQAEAFRDCIVYIERHAATPLRPNEYYHHQLIGLQVVTLDGEDLGHIVEIIETGANDVYVARGPRGEVLLPARAEVVKQIDLDAARMHVFLLPGLLEE